MGFQQDLKTVRRYRKAILHLTMLTSLVAATAASVNAPSEVSHNVINKHQQPAAIPFCNDRHERTIGRRLLYITTLDGRLSALDMTKNGKLRWSITTGPGPLISSSIHRLELTNNGKFVRMIPSLSGGIYKFDGESIDPIPVTAENLLSSSAKFSEDLVISGGKDARTYGVSARTGQVLYESSMNGSINSTDNNGQQRTTAAETISEDDVSVDDDNDSVESDGRNQIIIEPHDDLIDDVIVVRRQTQTVRAIETRTGNERWNFSVGQHELYLSKPNDCHDHKFNDLDMAVLDIEIKVIVPEGMICAFSKTEPDLMLWKYKFEHPIVSAWKIGVKEDLENIDLFGSAQWLWNQDDIFDMPLPSVSPSIYVGMYERQLYIQESVHLRREIMDQSNMFNHLSSGEVNLPKIPWRPIAASSNALLIIQDNKAIAGGTLPSNHVDQTTAIHGHELVPYDENNFAISAQSVLNASEYVNGNGFYLYTSDSLNNPVQEALCDEKDKASSVEAAEDKILNTTNHTIDDDLAFSLDDLDAPVRVVVLSLWFWWKEILVIAFTTAIVMNFLLGQRQHTEREIVVIERHIPVPTGIEATEASTRALLGPVTNNTNATKSTNSIHVNAQRSLSESTSNSGDQFMSRFQSDFDMVQCLGRGGFGVVFEVKNKLDDCKYAIKRITLPNKEESRKRVLREARTLASCEHQNIVRYFHSWVETPPPGWQENEDSKWLAHEMSTSIQIETPDGTTLPSLASSLAKQDNFQIDKKKQMLSWISSVETSTACSWDHEGANGDCRHNDHDYADDDDDSSCIVFRTESQSMALREEEYSQQSEQQVENQKTNDKKRSLSDAISIDIHSSSFDLSIHKNGKNVDYSKLSDSFQIEFVRSAQEHDEDNEQDNGYGDVVNGHEVINGSASNAINRKKRPNALALPNNNNNNGKNIIPTKGNTPPNANPRFNKVYLYIQMQLCRKESLRDWLRDNKTDARMVHIASIFHQIVDAVDYVHLKGLIHRDLKPSNIFFSQDGQIKIGDFGLVTDMSDIPNMITKCGDKSGLPLCARHTQQVGTHLYMSPEQLLGQHYNYKVDIYSLGLIFFELYVYFGTEMERIKTLRDLRDGKYPQQFCVDYAAEHKLLQQMLATNPEERPQTKELKLQLNQILKISTLSDDAIEAAALAEAARRLSRSRTFSSCDNVQ